MNITIDWKDYTCGPIGARLCYKHILFGGVAYVNSIKKWDAYMSDRGSPFGFQTIGFFETEHDAKCAVEAALDDL